MQPEYNITNVPAVYPCQTCPYMMQDQYSSAYYDGSQYMTPYLQDFPAESKDAQENEDKVKEEDGSEDMYRQPPFFGPRPFFPGPFFRPRPFFPPPFFGPRPFFPPPFFVPPFYPRPFYGPGFGLPFLSGLALGGLLF